MTTERLPNVELNIADDAPSKQGFHINYDGEPVFYVTVEFTNDQLTWKVGTMSMDGRESQEAKFVDYL